MSRWSNTASATTNDTPPSVTPPTNLQATATSSSTIDLSWNDNTSGEDFFEIQRSTSPDGGFATITTLPIGSTSYTDQNLSPNTTYYYRARVSLNDVLSRWSNTANTTTDDINVCTDCIDLRNYTLSSYSNNDPGSASVSSNGLSITLTSNSWKSINLSYDVTPNTVLEFDFSSTSEGEIHGMGFDTDNGASSDRIFKVFGTQNWGIIDFDNYAGGTQNYQIPVGTFYTGNFDRLVFANDDDVDASGNATFSNIKIYESSNISTTEAITLDKTVPVLVYPNPASEKLYLENASNSEIKVYNTYGQVVLEHKGTEELDISQLENGIYFLRTKDQFIRFIKR